MTKWAEAVEAMRAARLEYRRTATVCIAADEDAAALRAALPVLLGELVEEWRGNYASKIRTGDPMIDELRKTYTDGVADCADRLSAALTPAKENKDD